MEILGWVFGMMGFVLGVVAYSRVEVLEKKLKDAGLLHEEFSSENEI